MGFFGKSKKERARDLVYELNTSPTPNEKKRAAKDIVNFAGFGPKYCMALKEHYGSLSNSYAGGRNGDKEVEDFWILWCMMNLWMFSEFDTNLGMQNSFYAYEGFSDPNDASLSSEFQNIQSIEESSLKSSTDSTSGIGDGSSNAAYCSTGDNDSGSSCSSGSDGSGSSCSSCSSSSCGSSCGGGGCGS